LETKSGIYPSNAPLSPLAGETHYVTNLLRVVVKMGNSWRTASYSASVLREAPLYLPWQGKRIM